MNHYSFTHIFAKGLHLFFIAALAVGLVLSVGHVRVARAVSEMLEVEASLSPPAPVSVSVGAPIGAGANFGVEFSSVERVCLLVRFQDDPLNPGETLMYGPFGGPLGPLVGITNVSPEPQFERLSCSLQPEILAAFLDGQEEFGIQMEAGSVIISSLRVQITGTPTPFPKTPVLDDFNRKNGMLGHNWHGNQHGYRIVDQQLDVKEGGPIFWRPESFGADQEAYITLVNVDPHGWQSLLLKVQGRTPTWAKGAIAVFYNSVKGRVGIETFVPRQGLHTLATFDATLRDGDQLGGRALADGTVQAYVNGQLIGQARTGDFFVGKGGHIGLWFIVAADAVLDAFGGGTITP